MIKETIIKQLNNVLFSKKKCFISIALVPSSKPFLEQCKRRYRAYATRFHIALQIVIVCAYGPYL